jgi:hypothetical protein
MANYHLYVYEYKFDFWALAFVLCTVCSFAPPQPARADLEPLIFGEKNWIFFRQNAERSGASREYYK